MKIGFDKVYCVSYCRNIEKQNNISKIMKYLGIDFEFIYGADMSNLKILKHKEFKFIGGYLDKNNFKHYTHFIGASYDHYTAVIHAYKSGVNSVLIFEDDCNFINDIQYIFYHLNNYPQNIDIVRFGCYNYSNVYEEYLSKLPDTKKYFNGIINNIYVYTGSQCYGICNRISLKKYIDLQQKNFKCCDIMFQESCFKQMCLIKPLAIDPCCISKEHKKIYCLNEKFK